MSPEDTAPSPSTTAASPHATPNVKSHACVLCQQRKVRCDRLVTGCSNCTKARVECIYRPPAPPRRRKRKLPETDLLVRLKHYEGVLKSMGVELDGENTQAPPSPPSAPAPRDIDAIAASLIAVELRETLPIPKEYPPKGMEYGRLVSKGEKSRYLENNLWTTVSDELPEPEEVLYESEDEDSPGFDQLDTSGTFLDPSDLLFRTRRDTIKLKGLHPPFVHIFKLWQIYLDNVNPLSKVVHAPTTQQLILEASSDLGNISKATEALMFAIYSSAVVSLTPEECQQTFGDSRDTLVARFRFATQQALINAGFLKTSDLRVLLAFEIFLLSISPTYHPRSLWALSGISVRIAQTMGLHRDGAALGLDFFEAEMRRRLWWHIVILDSRHADLCGSGTFAHVWDCRKPMNLNDSEITPGMQEPTAEHVGPTEMMFVMLRNEICDWLRQHSPLSAFDGAWNSITSSKIPTSQKMAYFTELEATLRNKFVVNGDPSIPLHFLTMSICKSAGARMRFLIKISDQKNVGAEGVTKEDRDELLNLCMQLVEYARIMATHPGIKRFLWHLRSNFQWLPFTFVLHELRTRVTGDMAQELWRYVEDVYAIKPELVTQTNRKLYIAVGNMTLKAWDAYEAAQGVDVYGERGPTPQFIMDLRTKRDLPTSPLSAVPSTKEYKSAYSQPDPQTAPRLRDEYDRGFDSVPQVPNNLQTFPDTSYLGPDSTFNQLNDGPMDWDQWTNFINSFESESLERFNEGFLDHY